MSKIVFNEEQLSAISFLKTWWSSPKRFGILQGRAGTGKTSIIAELPNILPKCNPIYTAPTNNATKQLELVLPKKAIIRTTHSALGFHFSLKKEKQELTRIAEPGFLSQHNLFVVDESSFIGDKKICKLANGGSISLFDAILQTDMKVLFVGHRSQLPEVDTNLSDWDICESPVFRQDWPAINLTMIERNSGELQAYINSLEELIYQNLRIFKNRFPISGNAMLDYIQSSLGVEEILSGRTKFIAYRNETVDKLNVQIRKHTFGPKVPPFVPRDRIILTKPINFVGHLADKPDKTILKSFVRKINFSSNSRGVVVGVKKVNVLGILTYELEVLMDGLKILIFVPADTQAFEQLKHMYKIRAYAASTAGKKEKAWETYHNLLSLFAELKHDYAITVHRAQGNTIRKVITLWDDIRECRNTILRHKLLYVATSRASQELLIRG